MKNNRLEMIALVAGAIAIVFSIILLFVDNSPINYTYIISAGFLLYIYYSWVSTRNDHQQIQDLETHVDNLKQEIARQKKTISSLKSEVENLNGELNQAHKTIKDLEGTVSKLESSREELEKVNRDLVKQLEKEKAANSKPE